MKNHTEIQKVITEEGYTYNYWTKSNIDRMYINDGKHSLGYINLATMQYHNERREGTNLWTTLKRADLIEK